MTNPISDSEVRELVDRLRSCRMKAASGPDWLVDATPELLDEAANALEANLALSERVGVLEASLMNARGHIDGLRILLSAATGQDSLAAETAIERIDAALTKGQDK